MKIKFEFSGPDVIPQKALSDNLAVIRDVAEKTIHLIARGLILSSVGCQDADIAMRAFMANLGMIDNKLIDIWNEYCERRRDETMSLKAGGYVRVSTQEQSQDGHSMENQRARIADFPWAKEWELVKVYEDGGFSVKDLERPVIKKLIEDAEAKRFDVVIVYRVDRLTRRQFHWCKMLEEVFTPKGIGFVSVTENFDTTTAAGKAALGMLGVFA